MKDGSQLIRVSGSTSRWQAEVDLVRRLRDTNGMPVDAQIVDAVAAFRLLGYNTVMSCGGHLDRRTTGPYVVFESESTSDIVARADRESNEVLKQALFRESQRIVQAEFVTLKSQIEAFNATSDLVADRPMLELRMSGHGAVRLCFVHSDFDGLLDNSTYRTVLRARRLIMDAFVRSLLSGPDEGSRRTLAA